MYPEGIIPFLMFLSCLLLWHTSESCSCQPMHPQRHYCSSHFVMKVKIIGSRPGYYETNEVVKNNFDQEPSFIIYDVYIQKVFKRDPEYINQTLTELYSPYYEGGCRVTLAKNTKYLVMGKVVDNKAFVNLCSYTKEWRKTSAIQRKLISRRFKKHCESKCEIEYCSSEKCPLQAKICYVPYGDFTECYLETGLCKGKNGKCRWVRDKEYKDCYERKKEKLRLEP